MMHQRWAKGHGNAHKVKLQLKHEVALKREGDMKRLLKVTPYNLQNLLKWNIFIYLLLISFVARLLAEGRCIPPQFPPIIIYSLHLLFHYLIFIWKEKWNKSTPTIAATQINMSDFRSYLHMSGATKTIQLDNEACHPYSFRKSLKW